jgi:hypothetical protein
MRSRCALVIPTACRFNSRGHHHHSYIPAAPSLQLCQGGGAPLSSRAKEQSLSGNTSELAAGAATGAGAGMTTVYPLTWGSSPGSPHVLWGGPSSTGQTQHGRSWSPEQEEEECRVQPIGVRWVKSWVQQTV